MIIPKDMKAGSTHKTNNNGSLTIIEYKSATKVIVKFIETNYITTTTARYIRIKCVKDLLSKKVFGVGCFGVGIYKAKENGKVLLSYNKWISMLNRCYSKDFQKEHQTYKGCTVCNDWLNYQNFAKWFYDNFDFNNKSYCLDKDMKVINNKVYSPEFCVFIPNNINCFITDHNLGRGDFMIGVHKYINRFVSTCSSPFLEGCNSVVGRFNTEQEAHQAWRKQKSIYANQLAEQQENEIVKDALLNYANALDNNLIYADGYTK